MYQTILVEQKGGLKTIWLYRPEKKNAFNDQMIEELTEAVQDIKKEDRALCLRGKGDTFCAGADINWMKASLALSPEENKEDAAKLSSLFNLLNELPIPLIGVVHKYAVGGGLGLVSVCDYVIATKDSQFSLPEVRLGLIPACAGPFIFAKIGESWSRALALSGQTFDAMQAKNIGLVHAITNNMTTLNGSLESTVKNILSSSPKALSTAKKFMHTMKATSSDITQQNQIAQSTLAGIRITNEAQEGLNAFIEKRKPKWQ